MRGMGKVTWTGLTEAQRAAVTAEYSEGDPTLYLYEVSSEGNVLWRTYSPAGTRAKKNPESAAGYEQLKLF
jgi:hypothetical protein